MDAKKNVHAVGTPTQADNLAIVPIIKLFHEFLRFVNWKATPRQLREFETQKEFAKAIGVSEDTLTDWKKHPQFDALVRQNINGWLVDRIPDVIGGLYEKAVAKRNAKDVEAFLRLAGMEVNKTNNK